MNQPGGRSRWERTGFWVLCLVGVVWLLVHAWVTEDAFISLRVVENALDGFGLRWNVDERVQVFTHPLWLLIHLPVGLLTRNLYLVSLILSFTCTVGAVAVAARGMGRSPGITALLLIVPLLLSRSFVDFSSSGLENPLSHLLAAVFGWYLLRGAALGEVHWFALSLTASLAAVNRLDTVLLYLPALVMLAALRWSRVRWGRMVLGTLPLVLWELFSLLYYGFPVPNTAYAKLQTGISRGELVMQGLRYAFDFLRRDPGGTLIAALALVVGVLAAVRMTRRPGPGPGPERVALLGLGVGAYVIYVIAIGGDFMSGRFFSLPVFASAVVLLAWVPSGPVTTRSALWGTRFVAVMIAARALSLVTQPPASVDPQGRERRLSAGIMDERVFFGLGHALYWPDRPERFRLRFPRSQPWPAVIRLHHYIGVRGYAVGPKAILIDGLALTDPLLARLPARKQETWRIGHFFRDVPTGYLEARATGDLGYLHPELAAYYEPLRRITSGPVFDPDRLRTIVAFNLGRYDRHREAYLDSGEPPSELKPGDGYDLPERGTGQQGEP